VFVWFRLSRLQGGFSYHPTYNIVSTFINEKNKNTLKNFHSNHDYMHSINKTWVARYLLLGKVLEDMPKTASPHPTHEFRSESRLTVLLFDFIVLTD